REGRIEKLETELARLREEKERLEADLKARGPIDQHNYYRRCGELAAELSTLRATNAGLVEALEIATACGEPEKASLYDEEGIEGWRWTHPDGREWTETGDWSEPAPLHPVVRAALDAAKGG